MNAAHYDCRQLAGADVTLLKGLLEVFADAFGDAETYRGSVPGDDYLARLLSMRHFIAVVAITGEEEVVGGLAAYELDKFEQDRREIFIYDLAVAEGHRRRGVATALIEGLRRIAAVRGAYLMFVQADDGDEAAIALYETFGRKETAHQFDIDVPSRAPKEAQENSG